MRSLAFNAVFWVLSVVYGLMAAFAALAPGRGATRWIIRGYTRRMVRAMALFAGIKVRVLGRERLSQGACIIAAKHQSYGDGFVMFSQFEDLAFVTGDHLERFPLVGGILRKLGAIVVDNCGGPEARRALTASAEAAAREGRSILIYPEGHLARAGERFRYRSGVFHMYRDFGWPVVPVATNLGLFWPQEDWAKHPGLATVEFLEPIPPGLDKAEFMARLEGAVETRTAELIAEATGQPVRPSVLGVPEAERRRAKQAA